MSCSFCYNRGHNITMCNDIKIDIYYHRIKNIFMYILRQIYPHNIENYTELGKSILNRFKLRELRAIGVQFCWQNARMNKSQLIPIIWDYFKTRIYYPPPLSEEETVMGSSFSGSAAINRSEREDCFIVRILLSLSRAANVFVL